MIDTDLTGAFRFTRRALKPMMRARAGRIVNIASVVGLRANPGQANYAAAKAGLIAFTKTAAVEVARRGITINAVAPGWIDTDMTADVSKELLDAGPGAPRRNAGGSSRMRALSVSDAGGLRDRRGADASTAALPHDMQLDSHKEQTAWQSQQSRSRARVVETLASFGPDASQITREATFEELDIDSLDLVELAQIVEDEYGVVLKGEDMKELKTVGDAIDLIVAEPRSALVPKTQVVITGLGAVTPLGVGAAPCTGAGPHGVVGIADGAGALPRLRAQGLPVGQGDPPAGPLLPVRAGRGRRGDRAGRLERRAAV